MLLVTHLLDNKDSKKRYRADVLVEDHIAKIEGKIKKEIGKAAKRFGESFDAEMFAQTNPRVAGYRENMANIEARMKRCLEEEDLEDFKQLIVDEEIVDPVGGSRNWTDVRQFNLMFSTELGSVAEGGQHHLFATRNCSRNFCELFECAKNGSYEAAFWYCSNRKGF